MAQLLVIEDDDTVRGLIRVMLENAGHEVLEASDGEEGVRLYRQKKGIISFSSQISLAFRSLLSYFNSHAKHLDFK